MQARLFDGGHSFPDIERAYAYDWLDQPSRSVRRVGRVPSHRDLHPSRRLGMLRTARARGRLHEMIGDPHPKVRRAAERAYEVLAAKLNA